MHAILVVDMAGMTLAFADEGAAAGVAKVLQLRRDVREAVHAIPRPGCIFKFSGDNAFCLFDELEAALACAQILRGRNASACSGIGWGELAFVDGDAFGVEMNAVCKLAEDLARAGEILLTPAAAEALGIRLTGTTLFKARTFKWGVA